MGRGRAKAKQTKVARDLKYNTGHTDLGALEAELSSTGGVPVGEDDVEEYDDPYAQYYDDEEDTADEPESGSQP
jgi:hypothetical protein